MTGNTNQRGFSLIELLVATAVISIVMVAATSLLLILFRAQRESRETLYMQSHARYVFGLLNERTRSALINYDFYTDGDPSVQNEYLALITSDGQNTVFRFAQSGSNTVLQLCEKTPQQGSCNPGVTSDWVQLTPADLLLVSGGFTMTPNASPFVGTETVSPKDTAPLVTMHLQLQMVQSNRTSDVFQTAVTPRYYVR